MSNTITLALLVENSSGVLTRVVGLISRRGFNIKSLAVGECEDEGMSRITIAVDCDQRTLTQMVGQLGKLYCVKKICVLQPGEAKSRELMLIKVKADKKNRNEILQICELFDASIIEATKHSIMLEFTGDQEKESAFMSLMREHEIVEMARTGIVALVRGSGSIYE